MLTEVAESTRYEVPVRRSEISQSQVTFNQQKIQFYTTIFSILVTDIIQISMCIETFCYADGWQSWALVVSSVLPVRGGGIISCSLD